MCAEFSKVKTNRDRPRAYLPGQKLPFLIIFKKIPYTLYSTGFFFSRLNNIDIGQKIVVNREEKVLEYIVRNKKIVDPEDFTILQPVNNKETITLMTCWPLGIGTKRLIVVAERRI